jgi:hypothetical protein
MLTFASRSVFFLLMALLLAAPSMARADEPDRGAFPLDKARERRSGLVIGLSTGPGLMAGKGYPNAASKIDDPRYLAASGVAFGSGSTVMVMGALADYLNFGIWFGGGSWENDDWKMSGGGGGFRVEAFPLFTLVPRLRDLGVLAQFGIGSSEMKAKHGASPGADGAESFIGTGIFYEFRLFNMLGGHFTLAPTIEYQVITSRPYSQNGGMAGVRVAFYGGP